MPRTDQAARLIAAPPAALYAALVDPEALVNWLPPGEMTGSIERFDARPGGSYRMVLTHPSSSGQVGKSTADSDIVEARFLDLVPNERVSYVVDFVAEDPSFAGSMTMTWRLVAAEGGTAVEVTAEGVPDGVRSEDHLAGMHASLAQLDAFVSA